MRVLQWVSHASNTRGWAQSSQFFLYPYLCSYHLTFANADSRSICGSWPCWLCSAGSAVDPTNLPLTPMRKSVKCYPSSPNGMTHREVRNCPPLGGPSPGQRIDPKYINPENFIRIRPKLFWVRCAKVNKETRSLGESKTPPRQQLLLKSCNCRYAQW